MMKRKVILLTGSVILLLLISGIFLAGADRREKAAAMAEQSCQIVAEKDFREMVQENIKEPVCDFFELQDEHGERYAYMFTGRKQEEKGMVSFQGALWYADEQGCILLKDDLMTEDFTPAIIVHEKESHLLFQTKSYAANDVVSYIWAMRHQTPELVLEVPYDCFLDHGQLAIVKSFFSNSTKSRIWQRYYLDWDAEKGEYREYKGKKLTEEQFLSYENAQEVKDIVEAEIRKELAEYYSPDEIETTEYEYLIRDNGILNINFRFFCGDSVFYYYTILAAEDGAVRLGEWEGFHMFERGYIFERGDFHRPDQWLK